MVRAVDDTTSTCGSCSYWVHYPDADGLHATRLGYCGWWSVPAWVDKHIKNRSEAHMKMREDEGLTCWQHTKRGDPLPEDAVQRRRLEDAAAGGHAAGQKVVQLLREQGVVKKGGPMSIDVDNHPWRK